MRRLLTRLWFLTAVSVLVLAMGIALTVSRQEILWIAISGSILTFIGAVAACRKILRLGVAETLVSNIPVGGGAILPTQDDLDSARQRDLDDRACMLTTILIVAGTPMQVAGYLLNG